MKKILAALAAGALIGALGAHAKLPPTPPKTDAEKAAEAEKAAVQKAKDAELLNKYQERAVANFKKNAAAAEKAADKKK